VHVKLDRAQALHREQAVLQDRELGKQIGDLIRPGHPEGGPTVRREARHITTKEVNVPSGGR
jgi:hypothetical protein